VSSLDYYTTQHGYPGDSDGDGVFTSPRLDAPVTQALAADARSVTLSFHTDVDDAGDELWVTFTDVRLKPRGAADTSCTALGSVPLRSSSGGPTVSTEIFVRERR
jgi:hypothetical protein